VRGPGSSPHHLGVPGSIALLDSLVSRTLAEAGLPPGTVLDRAEVYIAGADLPVEVDILTKAVGEAGWAREHRVDNDLFALLRAVAAAGDPVARSVVAQQADEVVALATVAARRLGLLDKAFTAVLGGGVLAARHPLLHDAVVAGIQNVAPKATISIVADPPVAGAALLALDAFGGTDQDIEAAVRAAVRAATG